MTHHCTCCEQPADCPVPKPPLSCVNAEVLAQTMNTNDHFPDAKKMVKQ